MPASVLIDTSAWIDFFRKKDNSVFDLVAGYLRDKKAVGAGIIRLELLRGGKSLKELTAINDLFTVIDVVDPHPETYRLAGELGYSLAKNGENPRVVDLLIAQVAVENRLRLLTLDSHFNIIQKFSGLDLVPY